MVQSEGAACEGGGLRAEAHAAVVSLGRPPDPSERDGLRTPGADGSTREAAGVWKPRGRARLSASVPRDAQICFSCVCFAFGQLLLPLFLAMLCSHLRVIIYV